MSGSSSDNEKDPNWRVQDPETAAENPKKYESIVSEPLETAQVEKDVEANSNANGDKRSTRGGLTRLQSSNSAVSEWSSDASETKSSLRKKRWYKRMNPLKWGAKPPVPETRLPSREYSAGVFSRLTFQWMAPLMTVRVAHSCSLTCRPNR